MHITEIHERNHSTVVRFRQCIHLLLCTLFKCIALKAASTSKKAKRPKMTPTPHAEEPPAIVALTPQSILDGSALKPKVALYHRRQRLETMKKNASPADSDVELEEKEIQILQSCIDVRFNLYTLRSEEYGQQLQRVLTEGHSLPDSLRKMLVESILAAWPSVSSVCSAQANC